MMFSNLKSAALGALATALMVALAPSSKAGVMVTVSAPGVQSSSVAGATTETFDARAIGSYTSISSSIGTYTASAPGTMVVGPNQFGGANQTRYLAVGAQSSPTTSYELNLVGPQAYFGLYWSAIDSQNSLQVYNGATLLTTITRASLTPLLSNTGGPFGTGHFGNPNTDQNTGEPYAFVNIFATAGDLITRLRFVNDGTGTGFESDNHTISAVPEPASLTMLGIGGVVLAGVARYRRRKSS